MSLALYRKYRPGRFAEVIGQPHVTDPLQRALETGRLHHAYLFSGPRGCGKTSSARIMARSMNCEQGPTPEPCERCESCVALAPNGPGSLDVIEIDAASHGLVDDARDLRERAFFAPVSSRFKVYIVDEAHMVTAAGFNALLKLVEEPPAHLKFVFATTEPDKVIGTIRSRTFHYPFRLVPPGVLRDFLAGVCEQENAKVDPLVLPLVVRAGAGSVRDALSVLDQLLAGAGPGGLGYADAVALLGYTDETLLDEVVDAVAAGDGATVFVVIERVVEAGHDPRRFTADLLQRFRDLIVLGAVRESADTRLLDVPPDALERMTAQVSRFALTGLTRAAEVLHAGLTEMRGTTSPRLMLELICARLLLPGAATDAAAVLDRVERIERRLAIAAPNEPPPAPEPSRTGHVDAAPSSIGLDDAPAPPAPHPRPVPVAAGPAAAAGAAAAPPAAAGGGRVDAAGLRQLWPQVLDAVKARKRTPHALLMDAQVISVEGREVVLGFGREALARRFADPVNADVLTAALADVLGGDWVVRPVAAGPGPPATGTGTVPAAPPRPGSRPANADPTGAVEGFDPDDDAGDPGADGPVASSPPGGAEAAAVSLLADQLGAKVIGDIDGG